MTTPQPAQEEDISCVSPSLARALPRQVPQSSDTDPTDSSSGEISPPPSLASHSPVLANNRFSPMVPTDKVIQISLGGKTHLKSQEGWRPDPDPDSVSRYDSSPI